MTDLPGLDLINLRSYLDTVVEGGVSGELVGSLITGGKSNLTYRVSDDVHEWVVRRPPLGHVQETAHDMRRESRVIAALGGSAVPVPPVIGFCDDPGVLGVDFFVMEYVAGHSYNAAVQLERIGAARTTAVTRNLIGALATLHSVDPSSVGLADFGRPDGFLERQISRWGKQLATSTSRELAGMNQLQQLLAESAIPYQSPTIVHGDYRLDNALVDDSDQVVAILDWEMATLGDPLTDLALLVAYQSVPEAAVVVGDAFAAPGYLSSDDAVAEYARVSGRDISAIGFYIGLAAFKLAVICEGIHYRYLAGQTVGEGFDRIGEAVEPIIAVGISALLED